MNNKCYDVHLKDFTRFHFLYVERSHWRLSMPLYRKIGNSEVTLRNKTFYHVSALDSRLSRTVVWSSQVKSHLNFSDMFQFETETISSHSIWRSNSFILHKLRVSLSRFSYFLHIASEHSGIQLVERWENCKAINNSTLWDKKSLKSELKPPSVFFFTQKLYSFILLGMGNKFEVL